MMSIFLSSTDAVRSGSFIVFNVTTLKFAMLEVILPRSKLRLGLGSVADFSNTWARAPNLSRTRPC